MNEGVVNPGQLWAWAHEFDYPYFFYEEDPSPSHVFAANGRFSLVRERDIVTVLATDVLTPEFDTTLMSFVQKTNHVVLTSSFSVLLVPARDFDNESFKRLM